MSIVSEKQKIYSLIEIMPPKKLGEIVSYMEFLTHQAEWEATEEVLQDKALMKQIKASQHDFKQGRTVSWETIRHEFKDKHCVAS